MVARIKDDMDKLDKQMTEAEATVESGSTTFKMLPFPNMPTLFNQQAARLTSTASSSDGGQEFQPVKLFTTDEFFQEDPIIKKNPD